MKNYDIYPQQLLSQLMTLAASLILLAICVIEHAPVAMTVTAFGLLLGAAQQQKTAWEKKKTGLTVYPPPGAGPIGPELAQLVQDLVIKHSVAPPPVITNAGKDETQ